MAVVEQERRGMVEILRFNRPEARNAIPKSLQLQTGWDWPCSLPVCATSATEPHDFQMPTEPFVNLSVLRGYLSLPNLTISPSVPVLSGTAGQMPSAVFFPNLPLTALELRNTIPGGFASNDYVFGKCA